MDNLEIKNKVALYNNGMKVTEHIYDKGTKYDTVTIMQRGNSIDVFNNRTKKQIFSLDDVKRYDVKGKYLYIYNKTKSRKRVKVYTLSGNRVFLPVYGHITEKNNYFIIEYGFSERKEVCKYSKGELLEIIPKGYYYSIILGEKYITVAKEIEGQILYGLYSYSGKEIVPIGYNKITPCYNCFLVKKIDDKGVTKYGLYGKKGRQLLKPEYDGYRVASYLNLYVFFKEDKGCLYDVKICKKILPLKFKEIKFYAYDCIYATEDGEKYSIYSYEGKKLLSDLYDSVSVHDTDILKLKKGDKTYYYLTKYHDNVIFDADVCDIRVRRELRKPSSIQVKMKSETEWKTLK